jgi:hypothetical protein
MLRQKKLHDLQAFIVHNCSMSLAGTGQSATKFRKKCWMGGRLVPPLASGLLGSLDEGPLHGDGLSEDLALVQLLLNSSSRVSSIPCGSDPGLFFVGSEIVPNKIRNKQLNEKESPVQI